ncbi:MAG: OmpA family protein [Deltaproteobacteria bacterium]|nr:OmpA family protein [Deltaproteobacteria bacterium]
MNLRHCLLVGAACTSLAGTAFADAPRVTAHTPPSWWPSAQFGKTDTVVAEDYGEGQFRTGKDTHGKTEPLRGRHWKVSLVRTPEEMKQKQAPDEPTKWKALQDALLAAGFKVVNFEQRKGGDGMYATLKQGDGADVTWMHVEMVQPFMHGQMEAVQLASNPLVVQLKQPASTPEKVGDKDDLPYLPPPPGEKLGATEHFNKPMSYFTGERGHGDEVPIGTGHIVKTYSQDATISELAFKEAYTAALEKAGWEITPEPGMAINAHFGKNNRDIYVHLVHGYFKVADQGSELEKSLAKSCKAAVYGLNFDFNKATLRPDSEPTLQQVLRLLKDDPKLQVEIGGHTDNVGAHDYNMKLSDQRAAAVKEWLIAHGIAGVRLSSQGYGDTQPLVPNSSDMNRAQNRRVELKKPNCK